MRLDTTSLVFDVAGGIRAVWVGARFYLGHGDVDALAKLVPSLMGVIALLDDGITQVDVIAKFFEPALWLKRNRALFHQHRTTTRG